MNIETTARKLAPLRPSEVKHWREARTFADAELRLLLDRELTFLARRVLGDYESKLLLSLPSQHTARGAFRMGTILYEQAKWPFGLHPNELLQGLGIFGRSGAGKTNVVFHLVRQLAEQGIPFLFLDWKRTLRHLLPQLKVRPAVFTPGRALAPLSFNPFLAPPNVETRLYAHQLVDVLGRAYTLGDGAKSVLQKALAAIYERGNLSPTPADILLELHASPAKGRAQGWHISAVRALESLSLASLFTGNAAAQTPLIGGLLQTSTIVELDALSDSAKQFLVPMLFLWLYSVQLSQPRREQLQLVLIIEEAHHMLYRQEHRSKESLMNRLLRQCREIGIGVIVVDQHPHLISSAALGNTFTTICLNQKDPADINKAAGLCLLSDEDKPWLSRLPVGQGIVKLQDRWSEAFLVQFPLVPVAKGAVTDEVLSRYLRGKRTGSGVPRALSGGRDGFGQVRLWDEPLDAVALALLEDVLARPDDGVKARYQRLGWSMERGTRVKDNLIRGAWLEPQLVSHGQTRTLLLRLSRAAQQALGLPASLRRESLAHEYWKRRAARDFQQKGYRVILEAPRRGRAHGNVDVLAVGNGEVVAIEVETGKSRVVENVKQDLLAGYDRIVVVPTDDQAAGRVERQLVRAGLLIHGRLILMTTLYQW